MARVARHAKDLGVDAGAGSRRVTVTAASRRTKATKRLVKTRGLVTLSRKAKVIIRTRAEPQWAYGVEAYGMTNGQSCQAC